MGKKYTLMTPEEKEKVKIYQKAWRERNREKDNKYKRESYLRNKEKFILLERDRQYKKRYGISLDDYNKLLKEQNGECKICKTTISGPKTNNFAVDHDHSTGEVRGLLCSRCNGALGWYEKHKQGIENYLIKQTNNGYTETLRILRSGW